MMRSGDLPAKERRLNQSPSAQESFQVILLSGLSGGGKTSVLNVFEDMRYYAVDGLPFELAAQMVPFLNVQSLQHYHGLIIGLAVGSYADAQGYIRILNELKGRVRNLKLIFVESEGDIIMRRYAATRRPHPLEAEGFGLNAAVQEERKRLGFLREVADSIIDTSTFSIHDLRRSIQQHFFSVDEKNSSFHLQLISFGFKYEHPRDADMLFDLRFLPNPYFIEELRQLSGKDKPIYEYVLEKEPGKGFLKRLLDFLNYLLPLYVSEGRYRVAIAFGCTGGRHRSVAVTEAVSKALQQGGYKVTLEHRNFELG
jgi:UPF0042 nucleotide-binding protein